MNDDDITIMDLLAPNRSRVYYYQGNFYHPFVLPVGPLAGEVKAAIRKWRKENDTRVAADRAHPDYKDLVQLFDAQMG